MHKELIQKLKKKIEELAKEISLSLVVLFGSYAHGNYTVGSDIDLPVNDTILGFRIFDGCVCCIDFSEIFLK